MVLVVRRWTTRKKLRKQAGDSPLDAHVTAHTALGAADARTPTTKPLNGWRWTGCPHTMLTGLSSAHCTRQYLGLPVFAHTVFPHFPFVTLPHASVYPCIYVCVCVCVRALPEGLPVCLPIPAVLWPLPPFPSPSPTPLLTGPSLLSHQLKPWRPVPHGKPVRGVLIIDDPALTAPSHWPALQT
jgi:hypothetical protein